MAWPYQMQPSSAASAIVELMATGVDAETASAAEVSAGGIRERRVGVKIVVSLEAAGPRAAVHVAERRPTPE